jgi:anti-anti-sigma regulatory factor/anti-sigma regulatory factor (Ser/Thr protein kinase)
MPIMAKAQLPTIAVRLTAGYHLHSVRRAVKHLRPILDLNEPTIVHLDLSEVTFVSPASLALLVATMRRGRENGTIADASYIVRPASEPVSNYLHRMDFLKVLFEKEPVAVADPVTKHEASGLKECEHFFSEKGGRDVATGLSKALQEKVETDPVASASLKLCLIELTENVHFHAASPHGGFAAAQTFKNSKEIEVAIVDLGIGIASSLRKNPEHAHEAESDTEAINAAIRPLVTATPDRNSGYGLAFTRFLLEMNSGRLIVWSGEGWVQFGENAVEKTVESLPGTLVVLRLHTDRPFDYERAYNQLNAAIEEIEGPSDDDVRVLKNAPS